MENIAIILFLHHFTAIYVHAIYNRYPNIACELLTSDVGVINDKLGNEEPLLESLYAFLEQPSPLNPLLASFFSKTIGNLITRKTEQVTHTRTPLHQKGMLNKDDGYIFVMLLSFNKSEAS